MNETLTWLLNSPEPWTRYRTRVDLLHHPETDADVKAARQEMLDHPNVRGLMESAMTWGAQPIRRHNDAGHPIYALSTLADFGLQAGDPGVTAIVEKVMAHQSPDGAFQSLVSIPKAFGGDDTDRWTWLACDAPTLLYALISFGLGADPRIRRAVDQLVSLVEDNGWRCACDPSLGKFRGPGKKADPCPIANVYALKVLALVPDHRDSPAARIGLEMLLSHWAGTSDPKMYLFGAGSDYRKLKYPFVWYDILHVADVLSRFPAVYADPRFHEMLAAIAAQADEDGRYTAKSMYQSWKGWSFADKKQPSPWLTYLVLHLQARVNRETLPK